MGSRAAGWWDGTWNPVGGCLPVSPGCRYCYAAKLAATQQTRHRIRLHEDATDWVRSRPTFNGKLSVLDPGHDGWRWPLTWRGARHPLLGKGRPSLIFVGDMSDLFHEDRPREQIDEVAATLAASHHIGMLLTKRTERMAGYFAAPENARPRWRRRLWCGFSAERQREFDARWADIRPLARDGWTVFASLAPMLGPVRLPADFLSYGGRAWAICSGEQGRGARYMEPDWARAVRDQCAAAGVPFFLLQMSKRKQIPHDLFVRQLPQETTQ